MELHHYPPVAGGLVAKRCPVCNHSFPDTAWYCDQDGADLAAVRAEGPRRRGLRILLAALLVCVAIVPFLAQRHLQLQLKVVCESVSLQKPDGSVSSLGGLFEDVGKWLLNPSKLRGKDPVLSIDLRASNSTPLSVLLESVRYTVAIGGRQVAADVWAPVGGSKTIATGDELPIHLLIPLQTEALHQGISDFWHDNPIPTFQVTGDLTVRIFGIPIVAPLEIRNIEIELTPGKERDGTSTPAPAPNGEEKSLPESLGYRRIQYA